MQYLFPNFLLFYYQAIYDVIVPRYVKLPTSEEMKLEIQTFRAKAGFPVNVFAALDGTTVPVSKCSYIFNFSITLVQFLGESTG